MSKQYGLIVPNKSKIQPVRTLKPAIFDDDSDSDSGFAKPTGLSKALKRQDRILREKAVEEDPTVFQYDELFDDMEAKRKESKLARKDVDRKPKYISKLLASAEKRKLENERRIERQVQKEREDEGEEFKDKESFVTSSYRAKLEEMKKQEEEEKRQEYLEAIGDVTKQGNLDGFYRHMYDQKGLYERAATSIKPEVKPDEVKQPEEKPEEVETTAKDKSGRKKRKYRKKNESSDSEGETKPEAAADKSLQHLPSNLDADSDFSIDSSDSDEEKRVEKAKSLLLADVKIEPNVESTTDAVAPPVETTNKEATENTTEEVPVEEKKPKIDIWKKRTVGELFDDALRRYFERKSLRAAGMYVRPV